MIREDAPETLRFTVLETPRNLGWLPTALRVVICRVLRVRPNANNWSDSNVWSEIQNLVYRCEWFKVYDIIEALYEEFDSYERGYEFEGLPEPITMGVKCPLISRNRNGDGQGGLPPSLVCSIRSSPPAKGRGLPLSEGVTLRLLQSLCLRSMGE